MRKHQKSCWLPILALAIVCSKISGSSSPQPVLTGPDRAYIGTRMVFRCSASYSSPSITYELVKDRRLLIDKVSNLQKDQPAVFFQNVVDTSEGLYHCKVTRKGRAAISNGIRLSVITPPSDTTLTSEPSPPVVFEGSRMVLSCAVARGSHLSYTWFFNRREVTSSTFPLLQVKGNKLVIEGVTQEHDGGYYCMAWSSVQDIRRFSTSTELQVSVKVHAFRPTISFSVFKEGTSHYANVTCHSSRGSTPLNFSLTVDDREVGSVTAVESLAAWFNITIVPGLDMGVAKCWLRNEVQELASDPLTLEVVPVGGDAKVKVEYLYGEDFKVAAAKLGCHISRGTFPFFSWLFNDSLLPAEPSLDPHGRRESPPHYALTDHGRILVLAKLYPEESGFYRCKARDSYDQSGNWVESLPVLVQVSGEKIRTNRVELF